MVGANSENKSKTNVQQTRAIMLHRCVLKSCKIRWIPAKRAKTTVDFFLYSSEWGIKKSCIWSQFFFDTSLSILVQLQPLSTTTTTNLFSLISLATQPSAMRKAFLLQLSPFVFPIAPTHSSTPDFSPKCGKREAAVVCTLICVAAAHTC